MGILRKIYNLLLDTVQTFLIVFAFFLVVYVFFLRPFQVSGNSMLPNFFDRQYILTNIIGIKFEMPKLGDVIVFKAPPDPDKDYIKRVIGVPGDTILIENGIVYVNGKILDQKKFLPSTTETHGGSFLKEGATITVPPESYFVMGDNRPGSSDSREWGYVPFKYLVGKSLYAYWPLDKAGLVTNPYE